MLRLNLGAGPEGMPGFTNVDLSANADIRRDLGVFPWPWDDASVDEILASHILEHFDRRTGVRFLEECRRILKRGGVLHLAVPDMDCFADCIVSGDWGPLGGYHWRSLDHFAGGDDSEPRPEWRHKYIYTFENLKQKLQNAGFEWVVRRDCGSLDNAQHRAFSLYLDATK